MGSETHTQPREVATLMGNGAAAVEVETEKSRRALLKGLGVAAAGAVVGGVLSAEEAEATHGGFNWTIGTVDPAIHGDNLDAGPGVQGTSATGSGLDGRSTSGTGVFGLSDSGTGAWGRSGTGFGVRGESNSNFGVHGFSQTGPGVVGASGSSFGVRAIGGNGHALVVEGTARFDTAGAGTIPANQNSVAVSDPAVTADSHITMTYTGNPGLTGSGTFAAVVWIERQPGTGFTARLSRRVTNATPFTYLIVEPG